MRHETPLPVDSMIFPLPARGAALGACLVTAGAYLGAQSAARGAIRDVVFVSILFGASGLLVVGLHRTRDFSVRNGVTACVLGSVDAGDTITLDLFRSLLAEVFHPRRMLVTGVLYGIAVASAPWVLHARPDDAHLRIALSAFLWAVNFVSAHALIQFLARMYRLGGGISADVWGLKKPAMRFTFAVSRRVGLLASVYIGLALTSILFSVLPLKPPVILYSILAGAVALAAVVVPPLRPSTRPSMNSTSSCTCAATCSRVPCWPARIARLVGHEPSDLTACGGSFRGPPRRDPPICAGIEAPS